MSKSRNLQVTGLTELLTALEATTADMSVICTAVCHSGADVAADEMKEQIQALKTTSDDDYGASSGKRYAYSWEKEGLIESMGIAPARETGSKIDFKVGFDGYASGGKASKTYPKGKANAMLANSINTGTSFLVAQPFIKNTLKLCKSSAILKMDEELKTELAKYVNIS